LELAQEVSFLNKASIKKTLENIANDSIIILDATNTEYIDYDVLELIREFQKEKAPSKGIKMSLVGFKNSYNLPKPKNVEKEIKDFIFKNGKPVKKTAGKYKKLLKQLEP
jgi:MFS superfamily sulfate permease-like transporter